jgi:hypothetical protein
MCRLLVCLFSAGVALAQHHEAGRPAEKPVALYKGLGNWRHPIATRNADAQKFFDQGLALLYGFNRYEALRSFRKASELDPTAAMPYWGMAMSTGPYINMGAEGDGDLDSQGHVRGRIEVSCASRKRLWAVARAVPNTSPRLTRRR